MPGTLVIRLPPITDFIILRASLNCLSSMLTSWVVTPEPRAILRRRVPPMIAGFRRSSGVMERMTASARFTCPSST